MRTISLSLNRIEEMNRHSINGRAEKIKDLEDGLLVPTEGIITFLSKIQGKQMLDVGCGTARYASQFVEAGLDYTGIDLSEKIVELARIRHPLLESRQMSFRKLDFPDNYFHGLWCCCSLNYEPHSNIPNVLKELRRVMAPDGTVFIIMPLNEENDELIVPHPEDHHPTFASHWNPDDFYYTLIQSGFKRVSLDIWHGHSSATFLGYK